MKTTLKLKQRLFYWLPFLVATFSLSGVFAASRQLTSSAPRLESFWLLLFWGVLMVSSLTVLAYDAYQKSDAEGKVAHRVWLFDQWHQMKHRETL